MASLLRFVQLGHVHATAPGSRNTRTEESAGRDAHGLVSSRRAVSPAAVDGLGPDNCEFAKSRPAIRCGSAAVEITLRAVITGAHAIIFTKDVERVRVFLREVLELPSVDAGGGWPIFGLPPAELAAHPTDQDVHHELYLMCDDIHATVEELKSKGVEFMRPVNDAGWGLITAL
jgi:hypothetical protein